MNKEKIMSFVKSYKKELLTVGGMAIGASLCLLVGKSLKTSNLPKMENRMENIEIPDGFTFDVNAFWREGDFVNAIMDKIPIRSLGKLGDEFVKNGFAANDTEASIIIGLPRT